MTNRHRGASAGMSKPMTATEIDKLDMAPKVRYLTCSKCKKSSGTLAKDGRDGYIHPTCKQR